MSPPLMGLTQLSDACHNKWQGTETGWGPLLGYMTVQLRRCVWRLSIWPLFSHGGDPPYWSTAWIDFLVMHFILPLWHPENLNGLVCSKLCYPYTHLSWSGSWLDSRPQSSLAVSHFKWPGWVTRLSVSHCTMCNFYSPGSTPAVDPIGIFQVVSGWLRSLHKFQVSCFTFLCFTELQSWVFRIDINA